MNERIHALTSTPFADLLPRLGVVSPGAPLPDHLRLFVNQADEVMRRVCEMVQRGDFAAAKATEFQQLLLDVCATVLCHPIVADNQYLKRFSQGVTLAQARHECQQFSVFALQFDVAQAKLVANAPNEEVYRERLQVLLNEKGIPYQDGFEGDLTGKWKMETVHFTWLRNMAKGLGLGFEDIGKVWVGLPGTVAFVDATFSNYASVNQNVAGGAALAIENWAANALWKPWIAGMEKLNQTLESPINLGYLKYHDHEEEHHSQATIEELLENFVEPWFDAESFLDGAERMLTDGVQAYYVSQLQSMPDRDDTWPAAAFAERTVEPSTLPRLANDTVAR